MGTCKHCHLRSRSATRNGAKSSQQTVVDSIHAKNRRSEDASEYRPCISSQIASCFRVRSGARELDIDEKSRGVSSKVRVSSRISRLPSGQVIENRKLSQSRSNIASQGLTDSQHTQSGKKKRAKNRLHNPSFATKFGTWTDRQLVSTSTVQHTTRTEHTTEKAWTRNWNSATLQLAGSGRRARYSCRRGRVQKASAREPLWKQQQNGDCWFGSLVGATHAERGGPRYTCYSCARDCLLWRNGAAVHASHAGRCGSARRCLSAHAPSSRSQHMSRPDRVRFCSRMMCLVHFHTNCAATTRNQHVKGQQK